MITIARNKNNQLLYIIRTDENGNEKRIFDLDTFKEHMSELTSLKGIKGYLAKIEKAPKVTKYEPCS